MLLSYLLKALLFHSLYAAGSDGPGHFFGVVHNNFDAQTVEARDIDNNLYSISRQAFSEKEPIYHGKIIQLVFDNNKIKFLRKLNPEIDIIGKSVTSCSDKKKK